jgi:hypothetical protein
MASSAYGKLDRPEDDGFSGSDDEYGHARTSEDVRIRDRETLTAEEEAEQLLGGGSESASRKPSRREARERRRREKRRGKRRSDGKGERRELMYEMEEGGPRSSSTESSASSSEVDMRRLGEMQARRKVYICTPLHCSSSADVIAEE